MDVRSIGDRFNASDMKETSQIIHVNDVPTIRHNTINPHLNNMTVFRNRCKGNPKVIEFTLNDIQKKTPEKEKEEKVVMEEKEKVQYKINTNDIEDVKLFWMIIGRMVWINKSDGIMSIPNVRMRVDALSGREKAVFVAMYNLYENRLLEIYEALLVNFNDNAKKSITSHAIAMGENWYKSVSDTPDLLEFIISCEEYQNFWDCIKHLF
jgi:hypothetical protein